jgi:IclR helix-turn-helix domain
MSDNGHRLLTLADVHEAFGRWLAFPEDDARPRYDLVDVALAVIVANRMEADPLWLFLVASPSSGKTEVIRSLGDVPDVFPLSAITAQTFASGYEKKGMETSLLPKIAGKTVVMKDFGTVLSLHRETRAEILAQMREIYDGQFSKSWGNGKSFDWSGKVGLLCGVTGIIDREYALGSILGERFLMYRLKSAPARTLAQRAIAQGAMWQQDQRQALRAIVAAYLDSLLPVAPPTSPTILEGVAALAEFTARARSAVFFDAYTKEIELVPEAEAPGRLAKQFVLLARALAVVRGEREVSLATYETVATVANDTLPAARRTVLEAIVAQQATSASTTSIANACDYPTSTARRYLQELAAHRLVTRFCNGSGKADEWTASEDLNALLADIRKPHEAGDLSTFVGEVGVKS